MSSSNGCILPPQVPQDLLATGVTFWDTFCCSFMEEDMARTNCITEEDIYNILDDFLDEDDVVLEVQCKYKRIVCS